MNQPRKEISVQRMAVILGFGLLLVKFFAWYLTNSNTVLTDALESIVNVVAGSLALYGVMLSAKPKDKDHPYGHGKIEFIVSGVEGGMIASAGVVMIVKSALNFFEPNEIQNIDYGLWLTAFSAAVNYGIAFWLIRVGKQTDSLPLIAGGKHLQSDAITSIAALISLAIMWFTGIKSIDNIVAILMGLWIIYIGYTLLRKSFAGIMDEADMNLVEKIAVLLSKNRKAAWIDIHNLRVIQFGNKLHIDCHMTLPYYFSLTETHIEMEAIAKFVNMEFGKQAEFFIHPDPCTPNSCSICAIKDCKVREHAFAKQIEWNTENISTNKKHICNESE